MAKCTPERMSRNLGADHARARKLLGKYFLKANLEAKAPAIGACFDAMAAELWAPRESLAVLPAPPSSLTSLKKASRPRSPASVWRPPGPAKGLGGAVTDCM